MFEYYTFGTQVHASGVDGAGHDPHQLSPLELPIKADQQSPTPPTHSASESIATTTTTTPIGSDVEPAPLSQPIETLVQEMSKQTLLQDVSSRQQTEQRIPTPTTTSLITTSIAPFLEADDEAEMDLIMEHNEFEAPVLDFKRLRRQQDCRFNNNPTNTRTIETLVEGMISTGAQCNVRQPPLPSLPNFVDDILEPDHDPVNLDGDDFFCRDLEVDEGFVEDSGDLLWLESSLAQFKNCLPTGPHRFGRLRYRGSAETALRCQNVVRNRPRMRKRKGVKSSRDPKPT